MTNAPWCTGGGGGQGSEFRREIVSLSFEKFRSCTCWRHSHGIQGNHFFGFGIVDDGLGFSTPAQYIPHGTGCSKHGAGSINGISSLVENGGSGSCCEWLSGDGHPMFSMQRWFLCLLCKYRSNKQCSNTARYN